MLASVGADELAEWEIFYRINPWGQTRHDLQAATIAREVNRTGFRASKNTPKLHNYMPDFDRRKPTLEQRAQQFAAWTAAAQAPRK